MVDQLNFLAETGRVVTEKAVEELQQVMRKLTVWVSVSDLKCIVALIDPMETGVPNIQMLSAIMDKQKLLSEYVNT